MSQQSYISKIAKEDILRILAEEKNGFHLDSFKTKMNVSPSIISKVIKELEKEKLIRINENFITLTKDGEKNSRNILRKHLILENYFQVTLDKRSAHGKAHILEHYVSEEVIKNIKLMETLRGNGISSTKFTLRKEGLIADINIKNDHDLFERLVSMGILPGEKIEILSIIPGIFIIRIKNKKFALDKEIAEAIKVLEI